MNVKECPVCHGALRVQPAGVSKSSGKPYPAFYACPNRCNLRGKMDTRVEPKATPEGWSEVGKGTLPSQGSQEIRRDVIVETLTNIDIRTKKILEILQSEMAPEDAI
jgi:hypothetical protein